MNEKKTLANRIRGWFPQEPLLKKTFHSRTKVSTRINPPTSRESATAFFAGPYFAALLTFSVSSLINMSDYISITWIIVTGGCAGAAGLWLLWIHKLNRWHLLQHNYLRFLFAGTVATVIVANVLFAFSFSSAVGYWIISAVGISFFTALFALRGRVFGSSLRMRLTAGFAVVGIVLLVFSMAQVSHVEAKPTRGLHGGPVVIVNTLFVLNDSIPDVEVAQNLTTNDYVYFEINVNPVGSIQTEASSVSVQVTNQSASAPSTPKIYLAENAIANATNGISKGWHPPENGTYYFRVHYDYVVPDQMDVTIGYDVYTFELVPTKVSDPLLSGFMIPALTVALAALATSLAFSVRRVSEIRGLNFQSQLDTPRS